MAGEMAQDSAFIVNQYREGERAASFPPPPSPQEQNNLYAGSRAFSQNRNIENIVGVYYYYSSRA
jgi:hypothetical protein